MIKKEQIIAEFPDFFKNVTIDIDDGWNSLIFEFCSKIKEKDIQGFEFVQIKQKFGLLRIYTNCDSEILELITTTESKSQRICELTGKPGMVRTVKGFYKCLCLQAYEDMLKKYS